ncbi:MAG: NAD(P)/FAD-dependent oxidoreductase [Planctomycetota bacterium]|jgi:predicted NAD/FAD-binding protein
MRIAIIGAGISGLTAAHLLARRHDVTVFEAAPRIGGHTNTVDVVRDGKSWSVDTGFIVYNNKTYPNFTALMRKLGVPRRASDMSFSVRDDESGLEYNGTSLNSLFAQRRNLLRPSFWNMIREIMRFNREAPSVLGKPEANSTLDEYLDRHGYNGSFKKHYLIPMGAAIWSMPRSKLREFPIGFFVRFFHNHGFLSVNDRPQWYVILGGSRNYLEPLCEPFRDNIRTSTPVESVRRFDQHVEVNGERFDEVVLGCHSDQALRMLDDPSDEESEILGALPYQPNTAVLHTDESVLPQTKLAWAAWNYHLQGSEDEPVPVTYNMNTLQSLEAPETFCVSLNRDDIAPDKIIATYPYDHPVYSLDGIAAQQRHGAINGVRSTHYCGAYWRYGFHEDGVVSGLRVAARFGESL